MVESTHAVVLHSEAKNIIEKYIDNGSPFEVNVPSWQRNRVMKVFKDNKVTIKIFDEVHEEVFLLMRRDSFKRFLQSDLYKVYLKHADSKLARKQRLGSRTNSLKRTQSAQTMSLSQKKRVSSSPAARVPRRQTLGGGHLHAGSQGGRHSIAS